MKDAKGHPLKQSRRRLEEMVVCDVCGFFRKEIMSCEQCNIDVCPDCYKTDSWEKYKNTTFREFKGRFTVEHPKY